MSLLKSVLNLTPLESDVGLFNFLSVVADLDECRVILDVCTDNKTACVNTLGSFECLCKKGFMEVNRKCVCKYSGDSTRLCYPSAVGQPCYVSHLLHPYDPLTKFF